MVDYKEDAFQRIVNVGWPSRERIWMFIKTLCDDSAFAPGISTLELQAISAPFSPIMLNDRSFQPVQLVSVPDGYPGISEVQDFADTQLLAAGAIFKTGTVKQWTYEQFNLSNPILTPESFQHSNLAAFNLSQVPANVTAINMSGSCFMSSGSGAVLEFFAMKLEAEFDPLPVRHLEDSGFASFMSFLHGATREFFKEGSDPVTTIDFPFSLLLDMTDFSFSGDPEFEIF